MARNMVGIHAGQEIGIHAGQLGVERLLFYAPSFMRASFAVMANAAFQPSTFSGRQALKAIAGMSASITMLASIYTMSKQMEATNYDFSKMDWDSLGEDLKDTWNPGSGQFFGARVGDSIVGLGGAMRSNMSLIGRLIGTGIEWNPTVNEPLQGFKFKSPNELIPDDWDHPFARWFRGKGSIPVGTAWDMVSGKEYLGYQVDPPWQDYGMGIAASVMPFWAQAMAETKLGWEGKLGVFAAEVLGARQYDVNARTLFDEAGAETLGMTVDEWNEKIVGPDGKEDYKYKIARDAIADGEFPEGGVTIPARGGDGGGTADGQEYDEGKGEDLEVDEEQFNKAHELWQKVEEDNRKRGNAFQAYEDEKEVLIYDLDLWEADQLTNNIDGTLGSGTQAMKNINYRRDNTWGQIQGIYNTIVGDSGDEEITLEDFHSLEPEAQLTWAKNLEHFTDHTGKIDWDAQDEMIEDILTRLDPINRQFYIDHGYRKLGLNDPEGTKAGIYDDANEIKARYAAASDDYRAFTEAGKYAGLNLEESERVDKLIETASMVQMSLEMQGVDMDRRKIYENVLRIFPNNKIVKTALLLTYPYLAKNIRNKEKEGIMMGNPDLAVFFPHLMTSFSDDFQEDWELRWGMGQNIWPGSSDIAPSSAREELEKKVKADREKNKKGGLFGTGLEFDDFNPF
jgi:hypothetical protein